MTRGERSRLIVFSMHIQEKTFLARRGLRDLPSDCVHARAEGMHTGCCAAAMTTIAAFSTESIVWLVDISMVDTCRKV